MAIPLSERGINGNGRSPDIVRSPEILTAKLVVATDIEGPHLLGDTALNAMTRFVHPSRNGDVNYGGILFGETYEWYEAKFDRNGLGQEGSDIVLALPTLMFHGVTSEMLHEEAKGSKRSPGSEEYVDYLKSSGAVVVGVTTAWDQPHRSIIINTLGLHDMAGTDFPIDAARETLKQSGRHDDEMDATGHFLGRAFSLISDMQNASEADTVRIREMLHREIDNFFVGSLGVSWDSEGKMVPARDNKFSSQIGHIMSEMDVIGDRRKAVVAHELFSCNKNKNALHLAIGDGFNDRRMLAESPWSIGLNGAEAAKAAKIGVITDDVNVLAVITEIAATKPDASPESIAQVVSAAQYAVGDRAIIHRGLGQDTPRWLREEHQKMKKQIRQEGALLP